jgi:hypothetical protein
LDEGINTICKMNEDFRWRVVAVVLAIIFSIVYTAVHLILSMVKLFNNG